MHLTRVPSLGNFELRSSKVMKIVEGDEVEDSYVEGSNGFKALTCRHKLATCFDGRESVCVREK